MEASKLIALLSQLPPKTEVLVWYDFQELPLQTVYQRPDGRVVVSFDEGNSDLPENTPLTVP